MCGRARCSLAREDAAKKADVPEEAWKEIDKFEPRYNIQPGAHALAVVKDGEGKRTIQAMTWGLVPSWTEESETKLDFFRMFNARSETVPEKSVFSRLLSSKRCIILLNGFYEWAQEHKVKQPYYVHYDDDRVMAMAGLYDNRKDAEGNWLTTFTILTTDSSQKLQWLHDRMPVLLPTEDMEAAWLSDEAPDAKNFMRICEPYNGEELQWHPVTPSMGKASFQGPECCKPLKRKNIAAFFKPKAALESGISREAVKEEPMSTAAAQPTKVEDASQSSPALGSVKVDDIAAIASAHEIKQKEHMQLHAEAAASKSDIKGDEAIKSKQEHGRKRTAKATPQKSSAKKARKGEGSPGSSPGQKKEGPMDSFLVKNPA